MRHTVTGGLLLLLLLAAPSPASPAPQAIPELDRDTYATLLAEHRGKVVRVNFWATWCKPCRYEIPGCSRIHQRYDAADVAVVAVSVDNDLGRLQRFVAEEGLAYPVYRGDLEPKREQGAFMIPLTLVYAPDGSLAERQLGYLAPQQMEDEVRRYLPRTARLPGSPEPAGALAQNLVGGEHPQ
jgi:thiol-disulfide isomerase/thioredoxin